MEFDFQSWPLIYFKHMQWIREKKWINSTFIEMIVLHHLNSLEVVCTFVFKYLNKKLYVKILFFLPPT